MRNSLEAVVLVTSASHGQQIHMSRYVACLVDVVRLAAACCHIVSREGESGSERLNFEVGRTEKVPQQERDSSARSVSDGDRGCP